MLLAFDTATPFVTVALHDGEDVVTERRSEQRMKHGEQLAPLIEQVMSDAGIVRQDLTALAVGNGIPVPAFSASLAYYDSYRTERLPANLLQAQRDYFGAHTFERVDKPGVFHAEWLDLRKKPK